MSAETKTIRSKAERAAEMKRRKKASESRKRWVEKLLTKERIHIADWLGWYFYNRTYAFTANHSMPLKDWDACDVEKMMKDIIGAIRRGEALSKKEPVDGWVGGARYEIAFDSELGQGRRVRQVE